MTLYEMIMNVGKGIFNRQDWAALGRGEINDETTINAMLSSGYEAMVSDD